MKLLSFAAALCGMCYTASATAQPISAVLRLKERVPMAALARAVSDPASSRYREFYTPEEIRAVAGPADTEYQALVQRLAEHGLAVVHESPTHLFLTVQGEAAAFESAFDVRIAQVDGKYRSLIGAVRVPADLTPVVSVSGLDTRRQSHPMLKLPEDGPLPSSGVTMDVIKNLYGFNQLYTKGLSGKGQHIAIATYDDVKVETIQAYYQMYNVSPAPAVDKVTFNGTPASNDNSAMETCVDAEFSGALAPGAQIHIFTSAHNDDGGEVALFTAILDDNRAKIANYSWGGCENQLTAQHKTDMTAVFQRAVAQGVNVMVASGDSGSACATSVDAQGQPSGYTDPMADWPAASPDVVAVGGTTLDTNASTLSETAWSGTGSAGGGGGGISTIWDLPTWQQGLGAPYLKRSYPDVAFNANPSSGETALVEQFGLQLPTPIGGTSIAAPQWSGFMALLGEARANAGKPAIGKLNPVIYSMSATDRAASFDDVTQGNIGAYSAGPGWDAATGWGGLKAEALLNYLLAH